MNGTSSGPFCDWRAYIGSAKNLRNASSNQYFIRKLVNYGFYIRLATQTIIDLAEMKITLNQPRNQGFGLKELMFGLVALAIAAHYCLPSLQKTAAETEAGFAETKEGVASLFTRRF